MEGNVEQISKLNHKKGKKVERTIFIYAGVAADRGEILFWKE